MQDVDDDDEVSDLGDVDADVGQGGGGGLPGSAEEEDDDDDDDRMDSSPREARPAILTPKSSLRLPPHISNYRELGEEATWTLSSAKPGNGAEALRNGETQTYWQSDGMHPHTVTVQFHKRVALAEIGMYCNVRLDESYTPKRIKVLAGTTLRDLEQVVEVELDNPEGWVMIGVSDPDTGRPLRTFTLQIQCTLMHQNGRDTHVRSIRLFGPRSTAVDEQTSVKKLIERELVPTSRSKQGGSSLLNFAQIR